MREDMAKVIVERPRKPRPAKHRPKPNPAALEDLPKQQGMRRKHAESRQEKFLNENLAPLRRYLERQVGRPWDKVYAEIAENLRVDSTVQQHVREHLDDFVARRNPTRPGWRPGCPWDQRFYVDPKDGLLKRTERHPAVKAARRAAEPVPQPPERIVLAHDRELCRLRGIWYEVRFAPLPVPVYAGEEGQEGGGLLTPAVRDVVSGEWIKAGPPRNTPSRWASYRWEHPGRRYAVAKRVLSRAELRRHSLANEARGT
jgi:hypothetical protein